MKIKKNYTMQDHLDGLCDIHGKPIAKKEEAKAAPKKKLGRPPMVKPGPVVETTEAK